MSGGACPTLIEQLSNPSVVYYIEVGYEFL